MYSPEEFKAYAEDLYTRKLKILDKPGKAAEAQYQVASSLYQEYKIILDQPGFAHPPQDIVQRKAYAQLYLDEAVRRFRCAAICVAAGLGYVEVIKALIAARVDVDTQNSEGYTPIFIAAREENAAVGLLQKAPQIG